MNNIIPTLKYIHATIKHKVFVFRAGLWTKAPIWRLIIHDWTKFTPVELGHYGRHFYGDKSDPMNFNNAWNHHQKTNLHHWEYWIPFTSSDHCDIPDLYPMPMPEVYIREMVADWFGAGRAYEGKYPETLENWKWYQNRFSKVIEPNLHIETKLILRRVLEETFDNKNQWMFR